MEPNYKEVKKITREGYEFKKDREGVKHWFLNGRPHREGGPALEFASGTNMWFMYGWLHREDGPAIEWADGIKEYYLNGFKVTKTKITRRKNAAKRKNNQF